jgi:ribosomal protein L37AE/L43A
MPEKDKELICPNCTYPLKRLGEIFKCDNCRIIIHEGDVYMALISNAGETASLTPALGYE